MLDISKRAAVAAREYRNFDLCEVEFRGDDDRGSVTFEGVASVVDAPYTVRDQFGEFTETIKAGAFNKTLKDSKADVALYVNHQWDSVPLATRASNTLDLRANPNLSVRASMDPVRPDVIIVQSAVSRRQMAQMSIGFSVPKDRQTWNSDYTERTIHEVKLMEVSIVKDGANPYTSASVRSFDELMATLTAADTDPDEIRRAIAHLESLIAPVEEERAEEDPEVLARLLEFWDRRKTA